MIDVTLGRELEAKATEGPWEVTYSAVFPEGHGPVFEFAYVDTTSGKRLTQDLRHEDAEFIEYMRNNAKDFFDAAERVEAWKSMRADGWEIAKTIQRAHAAERARDEAVKERDAYKRAKAENDDRFTGERDDARHQRDEALRRAEAAEAVLRRIAEQLPPTEMVSKLATRAALFQRFAREYLATLDPKGGAK